MTYISFNLLMFLCAIGVIGYICTRPKRGGELDSDAIVRLVVMKHRKSRKVTHG